MQNIVAVENAPPTLYCTGHSILQRRKIRLKGYINIWHGHGVTYAVEQQYEQRKLVFLRSSSIFHALRIVWSTLHHLCLSACASIFVRSIGEGRSSYINFLVSSPSPEFLPVNTLGEHLSIKQLLYSNYRSVFKSLQLGDVTVSKLCQYC